CPSSSKGYRQTGRTRLPDTCPRLPDRPSSATPGSPHPATNSAHGPDSACSPPTPQRLSPPPPSPSTDATLDPAARSSRPRVGFLLPQAIGPPVILGSRTPRPPASQSAGSAFDARR